MKQNRAKIEYNKYTLALLACALCTVVTYVYFLNASVVHVVVQKETMREIQDLKNDIALLESDYIAVQHTIASQMATIEGVSAERSKIFVARSTRDSLVVNQ